MSAPRPPKAYEDFIQRYPGLAKAWEQIADAGKVGPLDARTVRLVKLALAIGAMREGAFHSSVRKALAMGISREEIEQVVALGAGIHGMPSVVAVHTWLSDVLGPEDGEPKA
jgi:4-carboxymuconolactone decarboxylase